MDVPAAASKTGSPVLPDLISTCVEAYHASQHLLVEVRKEVASRVVRNGRIPSDLLDEHQFAAHG